MTDLLTILFAACVLLGLFLVHPGLALVGFGAGGLYVLRASNVAVPER